MAPRSARDRTMKNQSATANMKAGFVLTNLGMLINAPDASARIIGMPHNQASAKRRLTASHSVAPPPNSAQAAK
jgi:hypothetical protein